MVILLALLGCAQVDPLTEDQAYLIDHLCEQLASAGCEGENCVELLCFEGNGSCHSIDGPTRVTSTQAALDQARDQCEPPAAGERSGAYWAISTCEGDTAAVYQCVAVPDYR